MSSTETSKPAGRSPYFYGGLMFGAWGAIVGLAASNAINGPTALILMIAPLGLTVPMINAASRRADQSSVACPGKGQVQKRYIKRMAIFTSLYLAAVALTAFADKELALSDTARFSSALLPGFAVIGTFWAIGRLIIEEQDEFLRMLTVRQSLIATAIALSAASVWGFLEAEELVSHIDAFWWVVVWFFGIAVGAVSNRIKFGAWGAV